VKCYSSLVVSGFSRNEYAPSFIFIIGGLIWFCGFHIDFRFEYVKILWQGDKQTSYIIGSGVLGLQYRLFCPSNTICILVV
jgi:hypothetical protein